MLRALAKAATAAVRTMFGRPARKPADVTEAAGPTPDESLTEAAELIRTVKPELSRYTATPEAHTRLAGTLSDLSDLPPGVLHERGQTASYNSSEPLRTTSSTAPPTTPRGSRMPPPTAPKRWLSFCTP